MKTLKIAKVYSSTPGPRTRIEGAFSGEEFREEVLLPAIKIAINNNEILTVDLDGTAGYGPSFIEEAFGALIRTDGIPYSTLKAHLIVISNEEQYLIDDINDYMKDAEQYCEDMA